MAEKEGFEPPVEFPPQLISSQSHSATLPLLHAKDEEENEFTNDWQASLANGVSFSSIAHSLPY